MAFRYRASNVNGWSNFSPITYIQPAAVPSAPPAPKLEDSNPAPSSTKLTLIISASSKDNGARIDSYKLEKSPYSSPSWSNVSSSI